MKKLAYILIMTFMAAGVNAQIDRSVMPKPGPSPKVNVGQPQTFELKNGLKVMVVENHKLPRVSMNLTLDNPPFTEGNKKGVYDLTGGLMGNGTSKISKDDFQEEVDFMGANLNFYASGAYAGTLSKYFPRVLELMAQGATDPLFTQEEFDKEIARTIDGLKADEKNVQSNAQRVENVLVYGANHPKGEYVTEERIKGLTLADVKSHYNNYFVPNNAYLVIVGDVKFNEVKKLVEKDFSSWKRGAIPVSNYAEPKNVGKTEIAFVDMPNAVQSEVGIISSVNLKMTDKDYYPVLLANQIFGGDFNSYLNMNLREEHGWTYGARSSIRGDKYTGKFKAGASVRNEVTDSAVVEAVKMLKKIRNEKVSAEDLERAKAGMIGNFVMEVEKPQTQAMLALRTQTQGLPANFYENHIANINAVTPDQIQKAAQKYFSLDNSRVLVVGKASEVLEGLEKLGYPVSYFDRFGNAAAKPEQKQVDASVTVKSVMDKYMAAVGGDKAKAVKNVVTNYEVEFQGMALNMKTINSADGRLAMAMTGMGMTLQKQVFNGKTGYNEQQGQKMDFTDEEMANIKYSAMPFPEMILADKAGVKLGGIENFNGKDCYVIEDGKSKSYYDVDSGLKLGNSELLEGPGGQTMNQVVMFGEYKDYDGVKIPTHMTMNVGMDLEFNLTDVKFDQPVTDADFE